MKEFDNAWFAIRNNIDETVMNPRRAKLPNFVGGKQEENNAITRFCTDSKSVVTQCGYFKAFFRQQIWCKPRWSKDGSGCVPS